MPLMLERRIAIMAKGFIKLQRQALEESALWNSEKPFDQRSAWVDLLAMANHKAVDVVVGQHVITVRKGQTFTSIRKLSERWHWSKDRTLRYIKMLENLGKVRHQKMLNGTLISLLSYTWWTESCDTFEDTFEDTYKDTTTPQTIMIKNDKNDRRMSKNKPAAWDSDF